MISTRKHPLIKANKISTNGCLDYAIRKTGKTLIDLKKEIEKDKKIELEVFRMKSLSYSNLKIAKILNIKLSDVNWIIKSDSHNLSYRKLAEKYK
ncbi:hypothetical protein [Polaribacter aestuariivivens]|uniref:hypothetical protein n=1 Tax=Polaribacter aestuariivivens TaxID=2304626 RepID=UPI003F49B3E4